MQVLCINAYSYYCCVTYLRLEIHGKEKCSNLNVLFLPKSRADSPPNRKFSRKISDFPEKF